MNAEPEYKQGHSYLIRENTVNSEIRKVTILAITEKCYQLQYESGYKFWKEIKEYDNWSIMVEDLGKQLKTL